MGTTDLQDRKDGRVADGACLESMYTARYRGFESHSFRMKSLRKNISSGSPMEKPIGFSRAVRMGNVIAVAGTAPIAADGSTTSPNNVYEQTKRCIQIMKRAIEDAGGQLEDVIRTRIMLTDISRWEEAAKAHGEFFSEIRPVCTFVEVSGFIKPDWLVETEADCLCEPCF